ncbi:rab GTPase-binding effector protein 1-like isoform X2 [Dreissena polymorpha]|uniref:rab GTPase-binding effector protein 1-like isoform X2 n=1 Tax=Dreissena polymorpha TaxID=45954 RepID=UPI0022643D76|nr:rab GTPase-binding effector protein 1-like isoform X2 [Dreissena polymorpha]
MSEADDFGPMQSADEVSVLRARIEQLELREQQFIKQQQTNEVEFGQKRARFRELFLQKEAELKTVSDKCYGLEGALQETRGELEDLKAAVAVSEANKEEEISKIRRHCQQEVQSMQALLREAAEEASSSTAAQYETERAKLKELNENYEEEIQSIRSKLSQERQLDKGGKGFLSSVADIVSRGTSSLNQLHSESENLEEDMKKAQQDAEMLKSVVVPLEREIESLKQKLKQRADDVKMLERQKIQERVVAMEAGSTGADPTSPVKTTSLPSLDDVIDPEEKIEKLIKYLKAEKASRTDLEMFVAVINTQKATMQDENDKLRNELNEVCSILDEEKRAHGQLKETWQMANDQFLESQRLMMMDMRRMESLLSAEQQRLLAEQQKKDLEREAQKRRVKELEDLRFKQEQEVSLTAAQQASIDAVKMVDEATKKLKDPKLVVISKDKSMSNTSLNSNASLDSLQFDYSVTDTSLKKSHSNLDINLLSDQDYFDSSLHETKSLTEMDNLTVRISPEKVIQVPLLNEAQMRAITDPTPDSEVRNRLLATAKSKTNTISLEGRRLVSDKEWALVQEELRTAREKLGRPCDMCNNYEAQLQLVQDNSRKEQASYRALERESKAEKQTIDSQKKYICELEESLRKAASESSEEVSAVLTKTKECEKYIQELKQQTNSTQLELQDSLRDLTKEREGLQKELTRLQEENDSLQAKHSKHAGQLQNEDINLPNNLDDMQLLLLRYREEIIAAKVAKEHLEETLRSELMFLKDQVISEQQEKATVEETLTQEISGLQEKLAFQDSVRSELERETSVRKEVESRLRDLELQVTSKNATDRQKIERLENDLKENQNTKSRLENDVYSLRQKISSLQTDLDNSEAVQRDFVKLSQSLQIQLEQIRQAENEVRWQNEEDIDDCSACKQQFTVTKRKHHCRHCGRIFCSDCITKTVKSGPNLRPARVCDVCHTILVKDATPYFSTEPPNLHR